MGLYMLPGPPEGVLVRLLVNTVLSISLLGDIVRSLLHVVGLHRAAADDHAGAGESFADRFRSRVKPVRFAVGCAGDVADCRVCLARFDPGSVVDRLPCGHLFHGACLETWLDYHHATCPLCRTRLLPVHEAASCWPWR